MLREDVQAAIDHGSESESVEYKAALDSNSPADWAEIIKDIVALVSQLRRWRDYLRYCR
jgi:hypothetical protein